MIRNKKVGLYILTRHIPNLVLVSDITDTIKYLQGLLEVILLIQIQFQSRREGEEDQFGRRGGGIHDEPLVTP